MGTNWVVSPDFTSSKVLRRGNLLGEKEFLNSLFSSRLLWVHQTWNIWTAPASMTFTRSLLLNLFWSSRDWDGWRTSKPDLCFFLCICIFFHLRSLRLTCVLFEDKANPILNLYKSKLRKKHDHNRNVVIYNYWVCVLKIWNLAISSRQ